MERAVLVTGATGGIGEAICRTFAKDGYDIAVHYSSKEEKAKELCSELEKQYGIKAVPFKADFTNKEEVISLAKSAEREFGTIDVLVNNAGVAYMQLFQDAEGDKIKALFDINLMSCLSLTKEILPQMIRNQRGRIINISSMWGISGASCEVHYSVTKSAIIGFTKALAKEVGPSSITVNCVAPGFIDTAMNSNLDESAVSEIVEATPVGRKGTGEDVASLVHYLASDEAGFITGQVISVDGGYGI